jgi:hypothetical protein
MAWAQPGCAEIAGHAINFDRTGLASTIRDDEVDSETEANVISAFGHFFRKRVGANATRSFRHVSQTWP